MRKINHKGFTLIESLLILIAITLIGFVGYYVYHSQQKADDTLNEASSNVSQPAVIKTKNTNVAKIDPSKAIIYKDDGGTLYQISLLAMTRDQKQLAAAIDNHCKSNDTSSMNSVGATGVADFFTNTSNAQITSDSASLNMSCYDKNSKDIPWGNAALYVFVKENGTWQFKSAGQQ